MEFLGFVHQSKKIFRRAADRATPVIRYIGPQGAGRKATIGIALGFIVDMFAFSALIFFKIGHADSPKNTVVKLN